MLRQILGPLSFVLVTLTSSFHAAASQAELPSAHWNCRDLSQTSINGYSLELEVSQSGEAAATVFHSGFSGQSKVAKLNICTSIAPGHFTADGSTSVKCHDGAWAESIQADFELGGFAGTLGTATLSEGGPLNLVKVAEFVCTLSL